MVLIKTLHVATTLLYMIKLQQSSLLSVKRQRLYLAGSLSLLAYIYLCWNSQSYGQANLIDLLVVAAIGFAASVFVCLQTSEGEQVPLLDILLFALAFRLLGLFTFPILEDDFYRFLWDGFVTVDQGSPYGLPPSNWFDRDVPSSIEPLLDTINYPDIATVYGPSLQWLFALSYLIAPGEIWPFKSMILIADLCVMIGLLKLAPRRYIVLYAWSPLVIKEFVISMHPDLIGVSLMVFALVAYKARRDTLLGFLMALALGVKVFAIIILPFLLLLKWRAWLAFLATALLISLPFGLLVAWLPEGLVAMSKFWLFNAALYELFIEIIGFDELKLVLVGLFLVFGGLYGLHWLRMHWHDDSPRELPRGDLLFAGLLLILPALNPWYMVWILPFAVIWPSRWAWAASFALLLSYGSAINLPELFAQGLQDYQLPAWLLILEFGLILLAALLDWRSPKAKLN